jgi:hypothetical protein
MSPRFSAQMGGHPRAWIFTSATLAVQGKFHHYCAELGLGEPDSACWESPFDYGKQAVLYAPLGMPEPNSYGTTPMPSSTPPFRPHQGGQAAAPSSCAPACAPCAARTNCSRRGWRTKATTCPC